jgi:hypothetical protein
MGRILADDLASADTISLKQAISLHLQVNHYPPIPLTMIEPCVQAIEFANQEKWDEDIYLPKGIFYRGEIFAPVWAMVEQHHLQAWIDEGDYHE